MEIALLVLLFLVGTVASAMQALKYLDRKRLQNDHRTKEDGKRS
jgi:hypothetical protein